MVRDCKLKTPTRNTVEIKMHNTKQKKYWKENEEIQSSMIDLCATKILNVWHLDSGCSKYMGKDNTGKVTFGDSMSSKIIGKGAVVVNSKINEENVFLVENIKPNLLGVSQTCDQGHICIFDS